MDGFLKQLGEAYSNIAFVSHLYTRSIQFLDSTPALEIEIQILRKARYLIVYAFSCLLLCLAKSTKPGNLPLTIRGNCCSVSLSID